MSTTFEIDSGTVIDPISFEYEERFTPFKDSNGEMIVSAYRSAPAGFNTLTPAQFNQWSSKADGSLRSILCYAPTTTTLTAYDNVVIDYQGSEISTGLYFYGSEFRVSHISTLRGFGEG